MTNKKILIIDDDKAILDALKIYLEEIDYVIKTSCNPNNILLKIEDFKPDLILLDFLLANKNGIEIARTIRSKKIFKQVPIILMTAYPTISIKEQNRDIDGHIKKPFDMTKLVEIIKKNLD
ncbi:MAG: response regulator [Actinobacteria bacterium]|nr:response regulator [Actinomycetota bacterium]